MKPSHIKVIPFHSIVQVNSLNHGHCICELGHSVVGKCILAYNIKLFIPQLMREIVNVNRSILMEQ
jgi:hypothetical protein